VVSAPTGGGGFVVTTWDVEGRQVRESSRRSGAVWTWQSDGEQPIDYEIEWVQEKDVFLYGSRVRPVGWNVSELDPNVWTNDGTLEGAREVVEQRIPTMPR
jgi:hypothetical protein